MSFVFVSHASPDKKKIRHIVKALVKSGLKVWVDKPTSADLGFSKSFIQDNVYHLRSGGRWEDEIDEALNKAGCVLVCWSSLAVTKKALKRKERATWYDEAAYARTSGKLVACMIDKFDPGQLSGTANQQQMPMVSPGKKHRHRLEQLMDDVRRKLDKQNRQGFEKRVALSNLPPYYFINRKSQERPVAQGLAKLIKSRGGVRAFFIGGPDNECVDRFIDRLHYDMSSRQIGEGRTWDQLRVEWPDDDDEQAFKDHYLYALANALELPCTAGHEEIALSLAWRNVPVAVLSQLLASDWQRNEQVRIRAWLSLWKQIAEHTGSFTVLPILSVKMPETNANWYHGPKCPRINAGRVNTRDIWRMVQELKKDHELADFFEIPPLLHPVEQRDANDWRNSTLEKIQVDRTQMTSLLDKLFHQRWWQRRKPRVPLRRFASEMKPLFTPDPPAPPDHSSEAS